MIWWRRLKIRWLKGVLLKHQQREAHHGTQAAMFEIILDQEEECLRKQLRKTRRRRRRPSRK